MSRQDQSTSSHALDLLLDVDMASGRRAGVESALRTAIQDGRLRIGDRLPSTRALADDLGVARATVVAAYEHLAAEGYVVARRGSATTVAYAAAAQPDHAGPSDEPTEQFIDHSRQLLFNPGRPDLSGFPRAEWRAALRAVLKIVPDAELDYPNPSGCRQLRRSLAAYLARTRATMSTESDIVVTAGFLSALGIIAEHLVRHGHGRIAVEDPMLFQYRDLLGFLGVDAIPVAIDDEGISVDRLDRITDPVDAVLVCPARQYPLGMTMSPGRRAELVEWARQRNAWIIEDDYDGEFRYDGRPVGALQGLAPDRVIHAGTASKSLAPGIRLGWLTVPEPLRRALTPAVMARGPVSVIDQLTVAEMIDRGAYDRQVRTARARYRRRRDRTLSTLSEIPDIAINETAAGLNLCLRFVGRHRNLDDRAVEAASIAAGVGVVALSRHFANPENAERGVVVGFAAPPEHRFPTALSVLEDILRVALNVQVAPTIVSA